MNTSYPNQTNVIVSFRCSESLKAHMETTAQSFKLNNSELIRYGMEVMIYLLHNPMICEQAGEKLRKLLKPVFHRAAELHAEAHETKVPIFSAIERRELDLRNIKLLNREEHGFDGCRVTITRHKCKFERYFSAKEYGSIDASLAVALKVRDAVLEQLLRCPNDVPTVYARAAAIAPVHSPRRAADMTSSSLIFSSK